MKILILILVVSVSGFASALDVVNPTPRLQEMMKCNSAVHGTLWASFGHMLTSTSDEVRFFPTEFAVFAPDRVSRKVYLDFKEALKVRTEIVGVRAAFEFTLDEGEQARSHVITLVKYDKRIPNSYVGNWAVTQGAIGPVNDQVYCTID